MQIRKVEADVLVIGGGSAAVRAALEAARSGVDTLIVDKGDPGRSGSSPVALVGFSGLFGDAADGEELFLADWVKASGGICDRNLVIEVIRQGPHIARDLEALGIRFISNPDGSWFIARRAGHSARRTIMVKDHANAILPLRAAALAAGARLCSGVMITRLLRRSGRIAGAVGMNAAGEPHLFRAGAIVLAAGGANRLYPNPAEEIVDPIWRTSGDSYRLAFEVGIPLIDMEFCQFRDSPPAGPIFGAHYLNSLGERVMLRYDPVALESAPRSTMARAIYTENMEGRGPVVWHVEENQVARSRAPVGQQYVAGQTVPIVLQFQRLMGGAYIDAQAATRLPGLYAAGESSGGVQGGDRMQGCGFCETQVFGAIAGRSAAAFSRAQDRALPDPEEVQAEYLRLNRREGDEDPAEFVRRVQSIAWEQAGVVSEEGRLREAIAALNELRRVHGPRLGGSDAFAAFEAISLATTAELVAHAKLTRTESRSAHQRADHPGADPQWVRHVCLSRGADGAVEVATLPVNAAVAPANRISAA
ncbi:MAG TPA: FAD-dependent oxidoreductase [Steroidobacteraceae bacterium]|nr:FAD-dependent oxidoreductase [Steroidobacteraceae bacterium]